VAEVMIDSFRDDYAFLSNFYPVVLQDNNGILYPTVEHLFQSAKTFNIDEKKMIAGVDTPTGAKKVGKKVKLRDDWEQIKDSIMFNALIGKFSYQELAIMLLSTGDQELIEGNTWRDYYWGVCNGKGKNVLGSLLMQVREMLKNK
jgi:ribA/ribD-fused uncharacterized protein